MSQIIFRTKELNEEKSDATKRLSNFNDDIFLSKEEK